MQLVVSCWNLVRSGERPRHQLIDYRHQNGRGSVDDLTVHVAVDGLRAVEQVAPHLVPAGDERVSVDAAVTSGGPHVLVEAHLGSLGSRSPMQEARPRAGDAWPRLAGRPRSAGSR